MSWLIFATLPTGQWFLTTRVDSPRLVKQASHNVVQGGWGLKVIKVL